MNSALVALALLAPAQPNRTPEPPQPPAPDVRDTVRSGLKWLASQQKDDGTFEALNGVATTSVTSQAGLAFLMEGSTLKHGTYAPNLRKIVTWLEKNAAADGKLADKSEIEQFRYVASHAQALLFLSCAFDVDDDADRRKRLAKVLDRAVKFSVSCQTKRGGWGFVRPIPGNDFDDSYSTATVLQALFAARKAGIDVPASATDAGVQHLVRATTRAGGVVYSISTVAATEGAELPVNSAAAAAVVLMSDRYRPKQLPQWTRHGAQSAAQQLQYLRSNPNGVLLHLSYVSRAAFALGESGHEKLDPDSRETDRVRWSAQRAAIHKALKDTQSKDGRWADQNFGPAHTTALALIILQLDNDYLPAFSR